MERGLSFPAILTSGEPSVLKLSQTDYGTLLKFVMVILADYFNFAFPSMKGCEARLSADLIDTRPSWKANDFIHLCKFLRQSAHLEELKVYGQLTPQRFLEMVAVYEDHRAQALEAHHAKNKGTLAEQNKALNDVAKEVAKRLEEKNGKYEPKDEVMGREFEKVQEQRERTKRNVLYRNEAPDEKFFKDLPNKLKAI